MGHLSDRRRRKLEAREAARPRRDAVRESRRRVEECRRELVARHALAAFEPDVDDESDHPSEPIPAVDTPFADRHERPLFLDGLWSPAHLFLVSAGPSIRKLDLSLLSQRGICTMGLNNSPAIFRPDFWTYIDPSHKFHGSIWRDPGILKFVPSTFMKKYPLRDKVGGQFQWMGPETNHVVPRDMPGVVSYRRSACFDPETWLEAASVNWGNAKKHANRNKRPRVLNVLLAALGIAYRLGFRVVNLLGVDFQMDQAQPYAFSQGKSSGGCESNNSVYSTMSDWLAELKPRFDAAGFRVQNCNPSSKLRVFDYVRFDVAVREATDKIQQDPLDTEGWYG